MMYFSEIILIIVCYGKISNIQNVSLLPALWVAIARYYCMAIKNAGAFPGWPPFNRSCIADNGYYLLDMDCHPEKTRDQSDRCRSEFSIRTLISSKYFVSNIVEHF